MAPHSPLISPPQHIQAFAFDIDRTLTTRQKEITSYTRQILKKLVAAGRFYPFLCSGRALSQSPHILSLFPSQTVHVLDGGGTLATTSGQILSQDLLPSNTVKEIALQADKLGAEIEIEHQGKLYSNQRKRQKFSHFLSFEELTDWSTALLCLQWINDDVRQMVKPYTNIEVKEMVSEVNGPYMDITSSGVTKAKGLQKWSEITGISLSQVAGFGDSQNDLEFLASVGWKVAMGNSVPELKAIADQVIGDCDDDGLAHYIEEVWL